MKKENITSNQNNNILLFTEGQGVRIRAICSSETLQTRQESGVFNVLKEKNGQCSILYPMKTFFRVGGDKYLQRNQN